MDSVLNITNPNSIYIKCQFKFTGYQKYHLHGYVDTGASICIADPQVFPPEKWEDVLNPIKATIADNSSISLNKAVRNITAVISGEEFLIPTIYQQRAGPDLIIGNNFLKLYAPFVQHLDYILLHKNEHEILVQKVKKAFSIRNPDLMDKLRKPRKRGEVLPKPMNIASEKQEIDPDRFKTINLEPIRIKNQMVLRNGIDQVLSQHQCYKAIANLGLEDIKTFLAKTTSENPLDKLLNKALKNESLHAEFKLIDPTKVIRVKPMYYTSDDREEFKKQIKELLDLNVIRESQSAHSSPAFMVENEAEKRRGKKRMVVNYKELNKHTVDDGYFLPKKEELFNMIRGKKYFSTFDCKSGFWQIPLKESCRNLTAFSCPNGQYEWNVVPFGLKQAPGLFQRKIDSELELKKPNGLSRFCTVYVDDIIVFSETETKHLKHVLTVLEKCLEKGIILSAKKAKVCQTKINILGLEIENGSIAMQPHILTKIKEFPSVIQDKTQLQRFLGLLNYVEGYIPRLAEIRKPLQAKLKKDAQFRWTDIDTQYVEKLENKFKVLPVLYHPNESDYMILETDASHSFWGAVLKARDHEGQERLCRYTSGTFQGPELNYHSNEKEYLAVKKGISKFRIYLISNEFTVRSDNKNFGYFLRTNISGDYKQGRLIRWQQWFNQYKFKVEHIKGINNSLADCLTREFAGL